MNKSRFVSIAKWFGISILGLFLLISLLLYVFKDDICNYVVKELNKNLNAPVAVGKVDLTFWSSFPSLSVDFDKVYIQDIDSTGYTDTLLYSERIRLEFNPIDIWNEDYKVKKIEVSPGTLKLRVDSLGQPNYSIFKASEDATNESFQFNLEEVEINHLKVQYANAATNQNYITEVQDMILRGEFTEKKFTLNADSRTFIHEAKSGKINLVKNQPSQFNIAIEIDQEKELFKLPNATLLIANLPFTISGEVSKDSLQFDLKGSDLKLKDVVHNLAMSELERVEQLDGTGNVNFDLAIKGSRSNTDPIKINCNFGIANGSLVEPIKKQKIRDIQLHGIYSNMDGADKEHLTLSNVTFNTSTGPFSGNLKITEFNAPRFQGSAVGNIDLNVIHSLFKIPLINTLGGRLDVNSQFIVKALPQPNEQLLYDIKKCEGQAEFQNVAVNLLDDKRHFRQINGKVYLRNDRAGVHDLSLSIGETDLAIDGIFDNVIAYFKGTSKLAPAIQITSRKIRVEDLGTTAKEDQLLAERSYMIPNNIVGFIDLKVGDLSYQNHQFELISSRLNIDNRRLSFKDLTFRNAGANANGTLYIHENMPEIFQVETQLSSNNISLKSLFKEWNNFDQDVIRDDHIFGNAAIVIDLNAPFDMRGGVLFKAVKSTIQLKLSEGRLKNVETFESIIASLKGTSAQLAIGKENIRLLSQKLKNLEFETLENKILIQNGVITIPRMEIKSSAIDISTSGTHTFDNIIDYRFAFRFRDLKQNKSSEFGEIVDDGTGINIYMRMYGELLDPTIEWDKETKKQDRQEYNAQEKQTMKEMLKTEFGFFSKDSTIQSYSKPIESHESLTIQVGEDTTSVESFHQKNKKNNPFKKILKDMEGQKKPESKFQFEIDE